MFNTYGMSLYSNTQKIESYNFLDRPRFDKTVVLEFEYTDLGQT